MLRASELVVNDGVAESAIKERSGADNHGLNSLHLWHYHLAQHQNKTKEDTGDIIAKLKKTIFITNTRQG